MNRGSEDVLRSVPDRHPARHAIEQCLRALLLGVPGDWRLAIRRTPVRHDWFVRIEGPRCRWVGTAKECDPQGSARTLVQGFLPVLHRARVFS